MAEAWFTKKIRDLEEENAALKYALTDAAPAPGTYATMTTENFGTDTPYGKITTTRDAVTAYHNHFGHFADADGKCWGCGNQVQS